MTTWLHGVISRTEAQRLLFASEHKDESGTILDGVFLVRRKPQSGVSRRGGQRVEYHQHFTVVPYANSFCCDACAAFATSAFVVDRDMSSL